MCLFTGATGGKDGKVSLSTGIVRPCVFNVNWNQVTVEALCLIGSVALMYQNTKKWVPTMSRFFNGYCLSFLRVAISDKKLLYVSMISLTQEPWM